MELYQKIFVVLFIFLIVVVILFLYTQLSITRKTMKITTPSGKMVELNVEVVSDPVKRARGLMFRESLGENEGMLFVFEKSSKHGFWMVNTTIPLDAIHFNANKEVVDIIQMEPCRILKCPTYYPKADSKYVLEVNQNFSRKNNITEGSRFVLE